ncbi:MAG: HPF/RaiA family ribosome-associated protein [Bryobacteraceae bacterium]
MIIEIRSAGIPLTPGLRALVARRVRFAMEKFAERIQKLTVRLADVNGPRGGRDKRCVVRLESHLREPIVIAERQERIQAAVSAAAERASRTFERRIRSQEFARRRWALPRHAGPVPDAGEEAES